jgi:hypothetical protein
MQTLSIVGAVLAGVLVVATSLADQRVKVGDSWADLHAMSAIPSEVRQLTEAQLGLISAGQTDGGALGVVSRLVTRTDREVDNLQQALLCIILCSK